MILTGFVNTIIRHITDGNASEERMVMIMGGEILETLYDKAINEGKEEARKEDILKHARNIMQEFGVTASRALQVLKVAKNQRKEYLKLLEQ